MDSWVGDLVKSAGTQEQTIVVLSEGLEPLEDGEGGGGEHTEGNPHLWLDVANAQCYVERIRDTLVGVDPVGIEEHEANAERYLAELGEHDGYIKQKAATIPEERRKLVTLHDAFPYFAEAYGFKLVGVVLESPEAEPGSGEIADVVQKVEEEQVPAVFYRQLLFVAFDPTVAAASGVPARALEYLLLALLGVTIVTAVQAVGIVIVVALLVTPSATAYLLARRFHHMILASMDVGGLSALLGIYLSYYLNLASGVAIVLVATALFFITLAIIGRARKLSDRRATN